MKLFILDPFSDESTWYDREALRASLEESENNGVVAHFIGINTLSWLFLFLIEFDCASDFSLYFIVPSIGRFNLDEIIRVYMV